MSIRQICAICFINKANDSINIQSESPPDPRSTLPADYERNVLIKATNKRAQVARNHSLTFLEECQTRTISNSNREPHRLVSILAGCWKLMELNANI